MADIRNGYQQYSRMMAAETDNVGRGGDLLGKHYLTLYTRTNKEQVGSIDWSVSGMVNLVDGSNVLNLHLSTPLKNNIEAYTGVAASFGSKESELAPSEKKEISMQVCESIGNTSAATNVADGWMMIFPGQGSPAIGMGSDVCDVSPGTKAVWDCASDVSGLDVRKLCQKGPMTRLTKTLYQQLAVTTVNAAMLTLLRERTRCWKPVTPGIAQVNIPRCMPPG